MLRHVWEFSVDLCRTAETTHPGDLIGGFTALVDDIIEAGPPVMHATVSSTK